MTVGRRTSFARKREHRRKPRFCPAVLALLLAVALAGCGAPPPAPKAQMTIRFENGQPVRTGTELQSYRLEEGRTGELEISVETESGSVDISVFPTNAPDRFCYRGTALPTSVFTVTLAEAGEYTVQIQADRFIGSYGFAWKTF